MKSIKDFISKLNIERKYIPSKAHGDCVAVVNKIDDNLICSEVKELKNFLRDHKGTICKADWATFMIIINNISQKIDEYST